MTKFVAVAITLVLMLAVSVPAFAQATAVGGSVQYVDCDQVQVATTQQVNAANDQDLAGVSQSLSVDQNQVSACADSIAAGDDVFLGF
ncbi:MAG TPA: hypothetical protein VHH10_01730 [Rubrobacteraceae bacterium]|nr:hypothetical protein [Rubrobacteraceae bacterium]